MILSRRRSRSVCRNYNLPRSFTSGIIFNYQMTNDFNIDFKIIWCHFQRSCWTHTYALISANVEFEAFLRRDIAMGYTLKTAYARHWELCDHYWCMQGPCGFFTLIYLFTVAKLIVFFIPRCELSLNWILCNQNKMIGNNNGTLIMHGNE